MKKATIILFFIFPFFLSGQPLKDSVKQKRYGIVFTPTRAAVSSGLIIGPIGSESICGYPYYKKSNGLGIQLIGQGIFLMFSPFDSYSHMGKEVKNPTPLDSLQNQDLLRAIHNGVLVSPLGALSTKINGITLSPIAGMGDKVNGVALNILRNQYLYVNGIELGLLNEAGKVNGLQIGLINLTTELKGFQFGLWNVNEKRKLPILNWGF
ncbi:MAG: hypothetical protein ACJASF_000809 [Vicingaceae bacterium]|jgi:hypothetical protein